MNLEQRKAWNANHKLLTENILKPNKHAQTIELFLTNHALIHSSKIGNGSIHSLGDLLLENLEEDTFRMYTIIAPDTNIENLLKLSNGEIC